jgi:hypothetical protein
MTTSSPWSASSIRRERWVFASWIVTCRMSQKIT